MGASASARWYRWGWGEGGGVTPPTPTPPQSTAPNLNPATPPTHNDHGVSSIPSTVASLPSYASMFSMDEREIAVMHRWMDGWMDGWIHVDMPILLAIIPRWWQCAPVSRRPRRAATRPPTGFEMEETGCHEILGSSAKEVLSVGQRDAPTEGLICLDARVRGDGAYMYARPRGPGFVLLYPKLS